MRSHFYFITGTSKGIGEAIASELLSPENHVICISRTQNPRLQVQAITRKAKYSDHIFDLTNTGALPELMQDLFRNIDPDEVASLTLINNAGTIQPMKKIGGTQRTQLIENNLKVNLVAPILITEWFVRLSEEWNCSRRILNISSGAARRPISGWAPYCAAKSGLEMYTQCLLEEQSNLSNPVKVLAFAPGVVDTEMQAEIRSSNQEDFPEVEKFKGFKSDGKLISPENVAQEVIKVLNSVDFGVEWFSRIPS